MSAPRYLARLHRRGVVLVSIHDAKTPKARVVAHQGDPLLVFHFLSQLWSAKHIGHALQAKAWRVLHLLLLSLLAAILFLLAIVLLHLTCFDL